MYIGLQVPNFKEDFQTENYHLVNSKMIEC